MLYIPNLHDYEISIFYLQYEISSIMIDSNLSCRLNVSSNCFTEFYLYCIFQKTLLTRVLEEARQLGDRSLASVGDQFELCLAKCRTSSQVILAIQ